MADFKAPDGWVWVCGACGKTSLTHYGIGNKNGWDESCMMNAYLLETGALADPKCTNLDLKWQAGIITKTTPPEFHVQALARTKEAGEQILVALKARDSNYQYELREKKAESS
jgi:hypothetical protein